MKRAVIVLVALLAVAGLFGLSQGGPADTVCVESYTYSVPRTGTTYQRWMSRAEAEKLAATTYTLGYPLGWPCGKPPGTAF